MNWLICVAATLALFQGADGSPSFEVASVRPHTRLEGEGTGSSIKGGPGTDDPGHITAVNRPLRVLIIEAYGIRNFQIEHPDWMADARYDIIAKVPAGATHEQAKAMMRNLLAERFQLKVRKEKRDLPVYALLVDKGGVKMTPSKPDVQPRLSTFYSDGQANLQASRQSLNKMVTWLTGQLQHPVINLTKLQGEFDFSMPWTGEPESLVRSVQQLGLRMEKRKMPFDYVIVESGLKVPIEN